MNKTSLSLRDLNAKIGDIDDAKVLFRDVSGIGHWGVGDYQTDVTDDENLESDQATCEVISMLLENKKNHYKFYQK